MNFSHWKFALFYFHTHNSIFQIFKFSNLDGKPLMTYGSTDIMLEPRHSGRSRLGSLKEEESSEWSDASAKSSRDPRRVIQICFFLAISEMKKLKATINEQKQKNCTCIPACAFCQHTLPALTRNIYRNVF